MIAATLNLNLLEGSVMDELGFITLIGAGVLAGAAAWSALIWAAVQDGRDARMRSAALRNAR